MQLFTEYFYPRPQRPLRPRALGQTLSLANFPSFTLEPWERPGANPRVGRPRAQTHQPPPAGRYAKTQPAGVRAGLARTGYRLAVVKPILAEGYCRALVVGFAVLAEHANRDWCDNKRIGRVLRRA